MKLSIKIPGQLINIRMIGLYLKLPDIVLKQNKERISN